MDSLVVTAAALVLGLVLVLAGLAVVAAAAEHGREADSAGGGGGEGSHCDGDVVWGRRRVRQRVEAGVVEECECGGRARKKELVWWFGELAGLTGG